MSVMLLFLFTVAYVVAVDRNVADYLYLKLVAEPSLWARTTLFKYRLLLQLRYDTYLIRRGHISRKYVKMAQEISKSTRKPE